jgi:hypothetical protein
MGKRGGRRVDESAAAVIRQRELRADLTRLSRRPSAAEAAPQYPPRGQIHLAWLPLCPAGPSRHRDCRQRWLHCGRWKRTAPCLPEPRARAGRHPARRRLLLSHALLTGTWERRRGKGRSGGASHGAEMPRCGSGCRGWLGDGFHGRVGRLTRRDAAVSRERFVCAWFHGAWGCGDARHVLS